MIKVSGNTCKRGEIYARKEVTNPTRIVTSTRLSFLAPDIEEAVLWSASSLPFLPVPLPDAFCGSPFPRQNKRSHNNSYTPLLHETALSVLIPENEISEKMGVEMNRATSGPKVNESLETNIKGVHFLRNFILRYQPHRK